MKNTDKNINMLKKLTAEYRAVSEEKEKLNKSIKGFLRRLDIKTEFVKELSKMKIKELKQNQAEELAKALVRIHFPEVSNMWRDGRDYLPF
tara:strand:- start:118 stop:390 length:273 start_codon:yes stop_codon:yes gene_type:complete